MKQFKNNSNIIGELRLYQLLILKLLIELRRVCELSGCKYYLIAGSLLGAKRHKGFIPWDTDIDVGMLRKDYNKFLSISQELFSNEVRLQTENTDEKNPRCFARIRLVGTQVSEIGNFQSDLSGLHGFYLDIFPIDTYPFSQPTRFDVFVQNLYRIAVRLKAFKAGKRSSSSTIRTIIGYFIGIVGYLIPYTMLTQWLHFWVNRFNKCDYLYVTNFNSKYGLKKQTMDVSIYGEGKKVLFEFYYFNAPSKYVQWLDRIYGNWSELPNLCNFAPLSLPSGYIYDFGRFKIGFGKSEDVAKKLIGL